MNHVTEPCPFEISDYVVSTAHFQTVSVTVTYSFQTGVWELCIWFAQAIAVKFAVYVSADFIISSISPKISFTMRPVTISQRVIESFHKSLILFFLVF